MRTQPEPSYKSEKEKEAGIVMFLEMETKSSLDKGGAIRLD